MWITWGSVLITILVQIELFVLYGRMVINICGHGLVVKYLLAKEESGVRFPLPAQNKNYFRKLTV